MKRYDLVTVMSNVLERPSGRMVEYEEVAAIIAEKDKEIEALQARVEYWQSFYERERVDVDSLAEQLAEAHRRLFTNR